MKEKQVRNKLSISLPNDISEWLRQQAAKRRTSVSFLIRESLIPAFEDQNSNTEGEMKKTKGKVSA